MPGASNLISDVATKPSIKEAEDRLRASFMCRYERGSLIQAYSRQHIESPTTRKVTSLAL